MELHYKSSQLVDADLVERAYREQYITEYATATKVYSKALERERRKANRQEAEMWALGAVFFAGTLYGVRKERAKRRRIMPDMLRNAKMEDAI